VNKAWTEGWHFSKKKHKVIVKKTMKFTSTHTLLLVVVSLFLLYKFIPTSRPHRGKWTVYGTNGCGWTRKQLKHMEEKGIPHKFIDCDKNDCGDITAFPTLQDPSGKRITGYSLVE